MSLRNNLENKRKKMVENQKNKKMSDMKKEEIKEEKKENGDDKEEVKETMETPINEEKKEESLEFVKKEEKKYDYTPLYDIVKLNNDKFKVDLIESIVSGDKDGNGKAFQTSEEVFNTREEAEEAVKKNRQKWGTILLSNKNFNDQNLRDILQGIKGIEGGILGAKYANSKEIVKEQGKKLEELVDIVISKKGNEDLSKYITKLSKELNLSEKVIMEVYQSEEDNIIAEAQQEINKNTNIWKKLGKTAAKSAMYIGAGTLATTSAVASLGLGVGVSAGIIAGARILDKVITEKKLKKKLDAKVQEIKKSKEDEKERENIKQRLAVALSLKKRVQIDNVDLNKEGKDERKNIIYHYVDVYVESQKDKEIKDKEKYKDNLARALVGLDNIDRFNQKEEEKMNKKGIFDKLSNFEKTIAGKNFQEKIVSTSVLVGLGVAAKELPVIRKILMGYAGWRVGGMVGDLLAKKYYRDDLPSWYNKGEYTNSDYAIDRNKVLDPNFRKNNPKEYLKLKAQLDRYENIKAELLINQKIEDLKHLNDCLESKINNGKNKSLKVKAVKGGAKVLGAAAGIFIGKLMTDIMHEVKGNAMHSDANNHVEPAFSNEEISTSDQGVESGPQNEEISTSDQGVEPGPQNEEIDEDQLVNEITNKNMAPGFHDSVWHSTKQIFEDHAKDLGYQGDINNKEELSEWAQHQTANALARSGDINDKVFEGNTVHLLKNENGNLIVKVEKSQGFTPSKLTRNVNYVNPMKKLNGDIKISDQRFDLDNLKINNDATYDINQSVDSSNILEHSGSFDSSNNVDVVSKKVESDVEIKDVSYGSSSEDTQVVDRNVESDNIEYNSSFDDKIDDKDKVILDLENVNKNNVYENNTNIDHDNSPEKIEVIRKKVEGGIENENIVTEKYIEASQIKSIDDLDSLPSNKILKFNDLKIMKHDNVIQFTTKDGSKFDMIVNRFGRSLDSFFIKKNNIELGKLGDSNEMQEALNLKELIYKNLSDKNSSLAKKLQEDIIHDRNLISN